MNLIDAILDALHDTQPEPDEPANPYLAGYCDAYAEIRARLERVLASVDDTIYVLRPTPLGYQLTRLSLRSLELAPPAPVPPPEPAPEPPSSDTPF